MDFWRTVLGPQYEYDPGPNANPELRCIGAVVCPDCNNTLAYLYDGPGGIDVRARISAAANSVADSGGKTVAWAYYGLVDNAMDDSIAAPMHCWRDHHGLWISARTCRDIATEYRRTARRVRRPAERQKPGTVDVQ